MAQMLISAGQQAASWAASALPSITQALVQAGVSSLMSKRVEGPRVEEIPVQTSTDGAGMARVFGRARIAGQVIWASRFVETATKSRPGGKGGGASRVDYAYSVSFAVGLCMGEISGIGRVWANGALLDQLAYPFRLYRGDETQMPDALIEAIEGTDAPAFRGTAYVVFEDLPLDAFGLRIPNLSFEVFRQVETPGQPRLETQIRGINLIPGSGEFAYAPETVMRVLGPGREVAENRNNARGMTDFCAALDDLQRDLPHCRSVQLVIAWFGDDLRCGQCLIRPGVETRDKVTRPMDWSVSGESRSSAYLVSQRAGRPAYGGTPDDASIVAAITELKARGLAVTLYPFILMDVPEDNVLPDPWGGAAQAAFPWRGRISCDPGPGQTGTVDQTADAAAQVAAFFGSAEAADFTVSGGQVSCAAGADWGLNRFILHCAALAQAAGGVDGFLIGSEMVSLTIVRDAAGAYPAVGHLKTLAAQARQLLGAQTRLSYAADWSEYSGHQPGGGAKHFHLDPLWADANIDAVAIDWYVPLSDWRAGDSHLDSSEYARVQDRDYLRSNVAGGEGYDWYYASESNRDAQVRTAITDAQHGEPWVWRYKDLVNWWSQPHHDRPAGIRAANSTSWTPMGKPIWLTEIGCPGVDLGSNQPNVFVDPKSAESALPHGSNGVRDDLIQRRYLEAMISHFQTSTTENPISPVYGAAMVDRDLIHVWAYDARPWPDFPARGDIWADGENWRTGHWLNGRAGLVPVSAIVSEVCDEAGIAPVDVSGLDDLVAGYSAPGPVTPRAMLEPLSTVMGFGMVAGAAGLVFRSAGISLQSIDVADLVQVEGSPSIEVSDEALVDLPRDLRLSFVDDGAEYRPGQVFARDTFGEAGVSSWQLPLLCDAGQARQMCQAGLSEIEARRRRISATLPPSALRLEMGDGINLGDGPMRVCSMDGAQTRQVSACAPSPRTSVISGSETGVGPDGYPIPSRPDLCVLDLPLLDEQVVGETQSPLLAAFAEPWTGPHDVVLSTLGGVPQLRGQVRSAAIMGRLTADLASAARGRWDRGSVLEVELYSGVLDSVTALDVLNGGNALAVEQADGEWEVLQYAQAELIAPRRYRLRDLLRGQRGTSSTGIAQTGARVVLLEAGWREQAGGLALQSHEHGVDLECRVVSASGDPHGSGAAVTTLVSRQVWRRPYAPVHVRAHRVGANVEISWVRCGRIGSDDWAASEIPLAEDDERYSVDLWVNDASAFKTVTSQPKCSLSDAELLSVYGEIPASITVHIAQLSQQIGAGRAACVQLDL
ncbi:MAG: glycoside hydrolase/phage tail family protein [Maricaulis sp.]|nr:glycoside hydrolase/phage tail family protein [Maricaulis sp.]